MTQPMQFAVRPAQLIRLPTTFKVFLFMAGLPLLVLLALFSPWCFDGGDRLEKLVPDHRCPTEGFCS